MIKRFIDYLRRLDVKSKTWNELLKNSINKTTFISYVLLENCYIHDQSWIYHQKGLFYKICLNLFRCLMCESIINDDKLLKDYVNS